MGPSGDAAAMASRNGATSKHKHKAKDSSNSKHASAAAGAGAAAAAANDLSSDEEEEEEEMEEDDEDDDDDDDEIPLDMEDLEAVTKKARQDEELKTEHIQVTIMHLTNAQHRICLTSSLSGFGAPKGEATRRLS